MYFISKCRFVIASIIIVFLPLISSCSSNPEVKDAENKFFKKYVQESQPNLYKIVNFKKINAIKANQLGMDIYVMVCQGTIEFQRDCFYSLFKDPFAGGQIVTISTEQIRYSLGSKNTATKGQKLTIEGQVNFVKTEKGWQID